MKTLWQYRKDYYSQNGEDGVIEEILRRLQIKKGWSVEFGAWDGKQWSNTFHLLEQGWKGIDIESDPERFKGLKETARNFPTLYIQQRLVSAKGEDMLDNILKDYPIPKDFELLSIDVDSDDYWQWGAVKNYKPKIVIVEVNSRIRPGIERIENFATSFTPMLKLGKKKGYTLVCHTGNMIFVRDDLIYKLNLPQKELDNPNSLFRWIFFCKKPLYYLLRFVRNQKCKIGGSCIILSLLLGYSVILGLLGHTMWLGGNWIDKEMILSFGLLIMGWIFIFPAQKDYSFKDWIKRPFVITMLIISMLIVFTLGEYLSQVGVPFLDKGMLGNF